MRITDDLQSADFEHLPAAGMPTHVMPKDTRRGADDGR